MKAPCFQRQFNLPRRLFCLIVLFAFFLTTVIGPQPVYANELYLPKPGVMVRLSPPMNPPLLKGIKVYKDNPFKFDFILDQGEGQTDKVEAERLIKYFFASVTVPEEELWVNLSPYEKQRIIPNAFGQTEMGRDLLAQDYLLKQITASLIYPEDEVGKDFWQKIYAQAQNKFGTTDIPVNTFNKVWIIPSKAVVYENPAPENNQAVAYVVEARLKVMLEQDYLALEKNAVLGSSRPFSGVGIPTSSKEIQDVSGQIVREIVLPQLEKEVNEGKSFAPLRQVYHSLILAAWYKQKIKNSILDKIYADKRKIAGVGYDKSVVSELPTRGHVTEVLPNEIGLNAKTYQENKLNDIDAIYQEYLKAFKKGVFNYIKEEFDPLTQEVIPRKYFSGGVSFAITPTSGGMNTQLKTESAMSIVQSLNPAERATLPAEKGMLEVGVNADHADREKRENQTPIDETQNNAMLAKVSNEGHQSKEVQDLEMRRKIEFLANIREYVNARWAMPRSGFDNFYFNKFIEEIFEEGEDIIPVLISQLSSENNSFSSYQYLLEEVLKKFGNKAIPHFIESFKSNPIDDQYGFNVSIGTLASIKDDRVPRILGELNAFNSSVVEAFRLWHEQWPNREGMIDKLRKEIKGKKKDRLYLKCVRVMAQLNDEQAMAEISRQLMESNDATFQIAVIQSLSQVRTQEARKIQVALFQKLQANPLSLGPGVLLNTLTENLLLLNENAAWDFILSTKVVRKTLNNFIASLCRQGAFDSLWRVYAAEEGKVVVEAGRKKLLEEAIKNALKDLDPQTPGLEEFLRRIVTLKQSNPKFITTNSFYINKLMVYKNPQDIDLIRLLNSNGSKSIDRDLILAAVVAVLPEGRTEVLKILNSQDMGASVSGTNISQAFIEALPAILVKPGEEQEQVKVWVQTFLKADNSFEHLTSLFALSHPEYMPVIIDQWLIRINEDEKYSLMDFNVPSVFAELFVERTQAFINNRKGGDFTHRFVVYLNNAPPEIRDQLLEAVVRKDPFTSSAREAIALMHQWALGASAPVFKDPPPTNPLEAQIHHLAENMMKDVLVGYKEDLQTIGNKFSYDPKLRQMRRRALVRLLSSLITDSEVLPSQKEFFGVNRQLVRSWWVSMLPSFSETAALNRRILENKQEHQDVRKRARENLIEYVTRESSLLKGKSLLQAAWKRFMGKRQAVALGSRYVSLEEYVPQVELNQELQVGRVSEEEKPVQTDEEVLFYTQEFKIPAEFSATPRQARVKKNAFVEFLEPRINKSTEQMEKEIDITVRRKHYALYQTYGFVPRNFENSQANQVYEAFDRLVKAHNDNVGESGFKFRGKLFIVDSPIVNAFVFSGRDDVYIHMGLVREMARFCLLNNIEFSMDMIAGVLGHEMRHIMQDSSYEGISLPDLRSNEALRHEVLHLKRQMEFDADEGGMLLMGKAGFHIESQFNVLKFLAQITPQTTAELAFATHPHPKTRLDKLQQFYDDERSLPSTPKVKKLDETQWINWKFEQIGNDAGTIHKLADVRDKLKQARSVPEVLDLMRIYRIIRNEKRFLTLSIQRPFQDAFARQIFLGNVKAGVYEMMDQLGVMKRGARESLEKSSSYGAFLMHLAKDELIAISARVDQEAVDMINGDLIDSMNKFAEEIGQTIVSGDSPIELKIKALGVLRETMQEALSLLNKDKIHYDQYVNATPEITQDWPHVVTQLAAGETRTLRAAMEQLATKPFVFYQLYGKSSLDEMMSSEEYARSAGGVSLSWMGMGNAQLDSGDIYLERADSGFYAKNLKLWPVNTLEERKRIWQALLLSFLREKAQEAEIEPYNDYDGDRLDESLKVAAKNIAPWVERHIPPSKRGDPRFVSDFLLKLQRSLWEDSAKAKKVLSEELPIEFMPPNDKEIFSDIFGQELDSKVAQFYPYFERIGTPSEEFSYQRIEAQENASDAARHILSKIKEAEAKNKANRSVISETAQWSMVKETVAQELRQYSFDFRAKVLNDFIGGRSHSRSLILDPLAILELADGLIPSNILYELIYKYTEKTYLLGLDVEYSSQRKEKAIKAIEWIFDKKPSKFIVSQKVLSHYAAFRLMLIEEKMLVDYSKEHSEDLYFALSPDQIAALADRYIDAETSFAILKPIAFAGIINMSMDEGLVMEDNNSSEIFKEMSFQLFDEEIEKDRERGSPEGETLIRNIAADKLPGAFFEAPNRKFGKEDVLRQRLFLRFFDLNRQQLSVLAKGQRQVIADEQRSMGRVDSSFRQTSAQELIDTLIILKTMNEVMGISKTYNAGDFFKASIVMLRSSIQTELRAQKAEKHANLLFRVTGGTSIEAFISQIINQLPLNDLSPESREKVQRFFDAINQLGIIGNNENMDILGEALARTDAGVLFFDRYADWMKDMQIPTVNRSKIEPVSNKRKYLQAMVQAVDPKGAKARVFENYDKKFASLMKGKGPLQQRLILLRRFLRKPSLFRDGYIDTWERQLVSAIDLTRSESFAKDYLLGGEENVFEMMGLMTFLQWGKVSARDEKGKPVPIGLSALQAKEALEFYRQTIDLIADPQRQLRMGALAMKIFYEQSAKPSFDKELTAIKDFFPKACQLRDEYLRELMDRHEFPSDEVTEKTLHEVENLMSEHQNRNYDQELVNSNFILQTMEAFVSAASRQDRVEFLFWMIDSANNPKPKMIDQLADKLNLDFNDMPTHLSFLPASLRKDAFGVLFLGENGLFAPHNEGDEQIMQMLSERLLILLFPPRDANAIKKGRQQFDEEVYQWIKKLFPIVLKSFPPNRRAGIISALLENYDGLKNMKEGEKLAKLLASMGPVGVKVGQILSENKNLLPNDALRSNLGSLKSSATPISKLAVIEALRQAGIPLEKVRIGRRLAAASMKQVHAGWYWVDGKWKKVVFKVLRPKIERQLAQDMEALKSILEEVYRISSKDIRPMAETVLRWIEKEKDFKHEVANSRDFADPLATVAREEKHQHMPMRVAAVEAEYTNVIIEEAVDGLEVGKMEASGRAYGNLVRQLRQAHLAMILKQGRFHADLHGDNVMVGQEIYWIDLGLIGSFNEQQRTGAAEVLKGLILHDARLMMRGIKAVHLNNGISTQDSEAVIKDIGKALNKAEHIKNTMNEILAIVSARDFEGKEHFTTLMKALTTAIWLFPTDLHNAKQTLDDLSDALELTADQRRMAIKLNTGSVLNHSLQETAQRMNIYLDALTGKITAPVTKKWEEYQRVRQGRNIVGKAAQNLNQVVDKVSDKLQLQYETDEMLSRTVTSWVNVGETKRPSNVEVNESNANKIPHKGDFLNESIKIFGALWNVLDEKNYRLHVGVSSREAWQVTNVAGEQVSAYDLLVRGLTSRILRQRYPNQKEDFILPQNPALAYLAQRLAEVYLSDMQLMFMGQDLIDRMYQITEDEPMSRMSSRDLKIENTHSSYEIMDAQLIRQKRALPAAFEEKILWQQMRSRKHLAKPGIWTNHGVGDVNYRFTRTGYSAAAKFQIDLFDKRNLLSASLELSETEFDNFINLGTKPEVEVLFWQRNATEIKGKDPFVVNAKPKVTLPWSISNWDDLVPKNNEGSSQPKAKNSATMAPVNLSQNLQAMHGTNAYVLLKQIVRGQLDASKVGNTLTGETLGISSIAGEGFVSTVVTDDPTAAWSYATHNADATENGFLLTEDNLSIRENQWKKKLSANKKEERRLRKKIVAQKIRQSLPVGLGNFLERVRIFPQQFKNVELVDDVADIVKEIGYIEQRIKRIQQAKSDFVAMKQGDRYQDYQELSQIPVLILGEGSDERQVASSVDGERLFRKVKITKIGVRSGADRIKVEKILMSNEWAKGIELVVIIDNDNQVRMGGVLPTMDDNNQKARTILKEEGLYSDSEGLAQGLPAFILEDWYLAAHVSELYHDIKHSLGAMILAKKVTDAMVIAEEMTASDQKLFLEIAALHDFDPHRPVNTPARVRVTLKELENDWQGIASFDPLGLKASYLKEVLHWSELDYLKAQAIIQRSEFPFWDANKAYEKDKTSPKEEYEKVLGKIKDRLGEQGMLPIKMDGILLGIRQEAAYFSEFIDKVNGYARLRLDKVVRMINDLGKESANNGFKQSASWWIKNSPGFLRSILDQGIRLDQELAQKAGLNGASWKTLKDLLGERSKEYRQFERTITHLERLNVTTLLAIKDPLIQAQLALIKDEITPQDVKSKADELKHLAGASEMNRDINNEKNQIINALRNSAASIITFLQLKSEDVDVDEEFRQALINNVKETLILKRLWEEKFGNEDIILEVEADQSAAMNAQNEKGGIDLTAGKLPLEVQQKGSSTNTLGDQSTSDFNIDPAMLERYMNAPGLEATIIRMEPMQNLPAFLGLSTVQPEAQLAAQ